MKSFSTMLETSLFDPHTATAFGGGKGPSLNSTVLTTLNTFQHINGRIRVDDQDGIWNPDDLIEVFDCVFDFIPTSRSEMRWSNLTMCDPISGNDGHM